MIDPRYLKEGDGFDALLANLEKRKFPTGEISNLKQIVADRRDAIMETEKLQARRNSLSKEIGELMRQPDGAHKAENLKAEVKDLADRLKELKEITDRSEENYSALLLSLPNILADEVPIGADEKDNVTVRTSGEKAAFSFTPLPHYELLEKNGDVDFERGVKLAGSRFYVYNENLASLERELLNAMVVRHTRAGYRERTVPLLVNDAAMTGTGQFPKFQDEYYRLERDGLSLIPTAEVPLTNLYADEILGADQLPIHLTAATSCFRREAGSHGKDTRGLIRVHQFQKVELVKFCLPSESDREHEALTADAEDILKKLDLHYRVIILCSGDISAASRKTYDLEVWMPGLNRWLEISSCSNFGDYQARRARIRFKNTETGKNEFIHTLNGSGVAAGRLCAALVELHQSADGGIDWETIRKKVARLSA